MKNLFFVIIVVLVALVSGCATTGYTPVMSAPVMVEPVYAPAPIAYAPVVAPMPIAVDYHRYSRGRSVSVSVGHGGYGDSYSQRAQADAYNRAQRAQADAINRAQRAQADAYNRAQRAQADAINRARRAQADAINRAQRGW